LIDDDGTQLGVVPLARAVEVAMGKNLDLIEVAPSANPPVCRVMDYGKWKYEQGKRVREAHKKQRTSEMKGVRMRPGIDEHDFQFKLKNALKFLKEGDKVKFTIIFRSREITHPEFARRSLQRIAETAQDIATTEKAPSMEGRTMIMILAPRAPDIKAAEAKEKAPREPKPASATP
jgi:translation initiation factor IF-3